MPVFSAQCICCYRQCSSGMESTSWLHR